MILELIIIFMTLILGGLMIYFILTFKRAHKLVLRDPMNKAQYIRELLMIETLDKQSHARRWKSVWWQSKYECERPPAEALDNRKGGKYHAEAYLVADGQHCWITDAGINIMATEDEDGRRIWEIVDPNVVDEEGKPLVIDSFKPYTVTQRHSMVSQHKKSIEISKNKGWTAERVVTFASVGVLGMVIIIALTMGGEYWDGLNQAQSNNLKMQENQIVMLDKLAIISSALGTKIDGYESTVAQTPQSQGGSVITSETETPPNE